MAVLQFSGKASEWYRRFHPADEAISFVDLVEAIKLRFWYNQGVSAIEAFKRLYQSGRVEEYMEKFERVKTRLLLLI
jgi:hypothetical protein